MNKQSKFLVIREADDKFLVCRMPNDTLIICDECKRVLWNKSTEYNDVYLNNANQEDIEDPIYRRRFLWNSVLEGGYAVQYCWKCTDVNRVAPRI